jgi:predicted RNA-binding Zn ribbon-like protein
MTDPFIFELDAGRPCLDFANTHDSASEHLNTYADLVAFALQSHLITRDDADWLHAAADADPSAARAVLQRSLELRAAIYAIFSSCAAQRVPAEPELQDLNAELPASLCHARVVPDGSGYGWGWTQPELETPLWSITRSAADLLTSDADRARVRQCGGLDCHWLFMDTSKNRSRQWCSMTSCGNRAKARRHYQRRRSASVIASQPKTGSTS